MLIRNETGNNHLVVVGISDCNYNYNDAGILILLGLLSHAFSTQTWAAEGRCNECEVWDVAER